METAVKEIVQAIVYILQIVPIGTNIGLAYLLWVMVKGSFLKSRGAIHSGLWMNGLSEEEVRRSWSAMRYGKWKINELLAYWGAYVASRNEWRVRRYGSYRIKSVDITCFWRPKLEGVVSQHYQAIAQKALPAIVLGVMISSGEIRGKRVPLLQRVVRCEAGNSATAFRQVLLAETVKQQATDEITVVDAEFELSEIQGAGLKRFVVRLANNCTARLNQLPTEQRKGRPREYGEMVRPLSRTYRNKTIDATPAQTQGSFVREGRTVRYHVWHNVVTSQTKVQPDNQTFSIYVFFDPLYKNPLVLASDVSLTPELIFLIYRERWPVEHPPLAAKQMIGSHRQFVFAPASCFRLPELALLAGNLLTHVAAILPPIPSGFWDRLPKATPGRLRRFLEQAILPDFSEFEPEFRKKNSVTDHLPKGVAAHRRQKALS